LLCIATDGGSANGLVVVGGKGAREAREAKETSPILYAKTRYDGTIWYPATFTDVSAASIQINGLAYNGIVWVASAGDIGILYSHDGMSWSTAYVSTVKCTQHDLPLNVTEAAWNGNFWVAVGQHGNNNIFRSYDGVSWTPISQTLDCDYALNAIAWNGTQWVAGGTNLEHKLHDDTVTYMSFLTSTDGEDWYPVAGYQFQTIVAGISSRHTLPYVAKSVGQTILSGATQPTAANGNEGDFFINTQAVEIYGPKQNGAWSNSLSLLGATGPTGPAGATGPSSVDLAILPTNTTTIALLKSQKGAHRIITGGSTISFTTDGFTEDDANWFCVLKNVSGESVTLALNVPVVMTTQVIWLVWDGQRLVGY
jgi:hypothetical protein